MSYTTQCPACQTRFKVSDAHLALADGMVRCGRCSHVFHAPSHFEALEAPTLEIPLVTAAAPVEAAPRPLEDDFELELPDFHPEPTSSAPAAVAPPPAATAEADVALELPDFDLMPEPEQPLSWDDLESSTANSPANDDHQPRHNEPQQDIAAFQQALAEALHAGPARPAAESVSLVDEAEAEPLPQSSRQQRLAARYDTEPEPAPLAPTPERPQDEPAAEPVAAAADTDAATDEDKRSHWLATTAFGLLGIVGVLLLLLQLAFINRTTVSAELPELRPAFETLCQSLGCTVPLPTQRQLIRTEWSELSFVPQHEHLIQLDATLKNLAPYPQAFPLMELSLKDGDDRVLIRKTLKPEQYLSADDLKLGRFNASSEIKILTRMEVQTVKALGYSLHFYYP